MHLSPARLSFGPWPILRLYDEDIQNFVATCDIFGEAVARFLLPAALCFWKVRGVSVRVPWQLVGGGHVKLLPVAHARSWTRW